MKQMKVLTARTIRAISQTVNEYNENNPKKPILKENIVLIIKEPEQCYLIYFE